MAFRMRGQGATEYLVLLAVVLIIALVSIALLGFFPGMATDAKITQSNSYWRGDAFPFGISEHAIIGNGSTGTVTLVIVNHEAGGTLYLKNVTMVGANTNNTMGTVAFAPGETRMITLTNFDDPVVDSLTPGMVYDIPVRIDYMTSSGVNATQYGAKNLIGKYT